MVSQIGQMFVTTDRRMSWSSEKILCVSLVWTLVMLLLPHDRLGGIELKVTLHVLRNRGSKVHGTVCAFDRVCMCARVVAFVVHVCVSVCLLKVQLVVIMCPIVCSGFRSETPRQG